MELKHILIFLVVLTTEISLVSSWGSLMPLKVPRIKPSEKLLADITRTVNGYIYIITLNGTIPLLNEYKQGFPRCFSSQKQEYFNKITAFKSTSTSAIKLLHGQLKRNHKYLVDESLSFVSEIANDLEKLWAEVSEQSAKARLNDILEIMNKHRPKILKKFVALYVDMINLYQTGSDQEKPLVLNAHGKMTGSIDILKAGVQNYVAKIKYCITLR